MPDVEDEHWKLIKRGAMKGLDKDQHPVRFVVVTSVVSGLTVAAMTAGAGQLFYIRLLTYRVPLWTLALLFLATVVLFVWGVVLCRARKTQVFFILCALNEKRWVAELIQNPYHALDRHQLDLVLKVPERDYVYVGQLRHLRNLRKRRGAYAGGIISPTEPDLIRGDLRSFCAAYPVVFVDIEPFDSTGDYPNRTAFVGYSQEALGACAASYVEEHARSSQISHPRVLVIGGKLHSGRQTEFVRCLNYRFKDAEFIVDEDGEYSRTRAREIVLRNLQERSNERAGPHYIFCTNDEMALGAVDALHVAGVGSDGSVVVVGVDGIREARALIDSQTTPLQATVVQDSCSIAEISVDLLVKLTRRDAVKTCTYLEPRIYTIGSY